MAQHIDLLKDLHQVYLDGRSINRKDISKVLRAAAGLQQYQLGYLRDMENETGKIVGIPVTKTYPFPICGPKTTQKIIKKFKSDHPVFETHEPLEVQADGNCLYRSISVCIFGLERWHTLVRVIVAHELMLNPLRYTDMVGRPDFITPNIQLFAGRGAGR